MSPLVRRPRQTAFVSFLLVPCAIVLAAVADAAGSAPPVSKVERTARVEPVEHVADGEELVVEGANGSIELRGEPDAKEFRIEAFLEVDGEDEKDVARRAQLARLYAERAPDGAVVVDAVFPGKRMARDRARIVVIAPRLAKTTLRAASGAIEVRGTSGILRATNGSGAIEIRDHVGPIEARTSSGAIVVSGASGGVRATSGSGAIEVRLADDADDHASRIESKSGPVLFEAGRGFDGSIDASTTGGAIVVDDPSARGRVPSEGPHRTRVEVGAAAVHSEIQTSTGPITIRLRGSKRP